jgi:type IV secretory pathway VirB10-like protein
LLIVSVSTAKSDAVVDLENPWGYREPTPTKNWGEAVSSEERKKAAQPEGAAAIDNDADDDVDSLPSPFKKEEKFVMPEAKPDVSTDDVKTEQKVESKPSRRIKVEKKEKRARSSSSSSDSSTESDSSSDRRRRRKEKKHVARLEKKEKKQAAADLQKQIDTAVADGKTNIDSMPSHCLFLLILPHFQLFKRKPIWIKRSN